MAIQSNAYERLAFIFQFFKYNQRKVQRMLCLKIKLYCYDKLAFDIIIKIDVQYSVSV